MPNGNVLANLSVKCCCLSTHWRVKLKSKMGLCHTKKNLETIISRERGVRRLYLTMKDSVGVHISEQEAKHVHSVMPNMY